MPTLILTPRYTEDSQALWRAAIVLNWDVERLTNWQIPDRLLSVSDPVLYLEALFGPVLAEQFGLRLLEPPDDWLPRLPEIYRKRKIALISLRSARAISDPAFIKPPNDKSFPAKVYLGAELPEGYDEDSSVLVAEVVKWEKEFRCFFLDRQPQTLSIYLRGNELQRENGFAASQSELEEAETFARKVLLDPRVDLPKAAVIDVGVICDRGWAVVELNSAWGSGIYGCDPEKVLQVLRHSAIST